MLTYAQYITNSYHVYVTELINGFDNRRMLTSVQYDAIRIDYGADSWLITPRGRDGVVKLLHNNYNVDAEGNRYFTGGFHFQNMGPGKHDLTKAVSIIENYSYDRHFTIAEPVPVSERKKEGFLRKLLCRREGVFDSHSLHSHRSPGIQQ